MPTYDYECKSCHHRFDLFQSMSDAVKRKCPRCGKNTLERLIGTGAAVIFKGSGFYQTDYRTDSYKKSAEADAKPAETKSDSKSDAKPAETKAADSKPGADKKAEPKAEPQPDPKPVAKPLKPRASKR